jgi:hypothetical protein
MLDRILSYHFGGKAPIPSYCKMYNQRPSNIEESLLCTGGNIWVPCPDFPKCIKNNRLRVNHMNKKKNF